MASSLLRQKPSESLPNVLWIMRFPTLSGRNRNYYWPCMSSECCSLWSFAMAISPTLLSFLPCQCLLVPSWRLKRDPHSRALFLCDFLLSWMCLEDSKYPAHHPQQHFLNSERLPSSTWVPHFFRGAMPELISLDSYFSEIIVLFASFPMFRNIFFIYCIQFLILAKG